MEKECTIKHQASSIKHQANMNHHIVVRRSARIQRRKENQMALYWGHQIKTQHYVASKRKTLYIEPSAVAAASVAAASKAAASEVVIYLATAIELEMQYQ